MQRGSEVLIPRPPAEVFPFLVEPELMRSWFTGFVDAERSFEAPPGTRFTVMFRGSAGQPVPAEVRVEECIAPSRLRYTSTSERFRTTGTYELVAHGKGTLLRHTVEGQAAHGLTEMMVRPAVLHAASHHHADLMRLRDLLQDGHAGQTQPEARRA